MLITTEEGQGPPEIKDKIVRESFFELSEKQINISSIKLAESGSGIIIRLYESSGSPVKTLLHVHPQILALYPERAEVTLMEIFERRIPFAGSTALLVFTPYEIKTLIFADRVTLDL